MGNPKRKSKLSREELLDKKRIAERKRKEKIKSDPVKAEELRRKESERYHKKKAEAMGGKKRKKKEQESESISVIQSSDSDSEYSDASESPLDKYKPYRNIQSGQCRIIFDEGSSNSEAEPDPYEDNDGDYGSDENYEPQQQLASSSSSEDIFSNRRQHTSRGPVALSDSSKSHILNLSSDTEPDDNPNEHGVSDSIENSPSLVVSLFSQSDNIDSTVQRKSPEPEEQLWSNTTDGIPDFEFDSASQATVRFKDTH
ncbi:protein FAM133-like [Plodia interpunctella]|uniref:protein FAM133-like n=1 Tax=Plodia interpunctella TaxID=58824 RepID=UPI0031014635